MIVSILGMVVTILGVYGGEALIKRWKLGPRATLSLGWLMGMLYLIGGLMIIKAMEAA